MDPLTIENWQPFADYMQDAAKVKVMHACQEDLELINHHLGINPANIFDTQFANAFVGTDYSLSYANLARRLLGVELEKQETRSNWLQRPLTQEQMIYAADDVLHLVPMYGALREALDQSGRTDWFQQDMSARGVYAEPDQRLLCWGETSLAAVPTRVGPIEKLCVAGGKTLPVTTTSRGIELCGMTI